MLKVNRAKMLTAFVRNNGGWMAAAGKFCRKRVAGTEGTGLESCACASECSPGDLSSMFSIDQLPSIPEISLPFHKMGPKDFPVRRSRE